MCDCKGQLILTDPGIPGISCCPLFFFLLTTNGLAYLLAFVRQDMLMLAL